MINDNEKRIKEKLDFFLREKVKVHVERLDRSFWNGYLIEEKNEKIWIFQEDKLGEQFLFLADIYDVDEFKEVKK